VCENHSAGVRCVAFAPEVSDRFATASLDCTVRVWDVCDYTVLSKAVVRDAGAPTCLVYSLDMLIHGWEDGRIRATDVDGDHLWSIDDAHRGGVTALVLSHNQRFIITGGQEGEVRVWELRSRELVSHLKEHNMRVTSLMIYEDDVHALSCSRDRAFLCWDLRRERRISSHKQRMGGINSIALSNDQTVVVTAGQERRVTFWDLREHNPSHSHSTGQGQAEGDSGDEVLAMAISHSGAVFATGGTGERVKLWDYESGALMSEGIGHSGCIHSLKFSPDDRQLVSVGDDGNIFLWNLYT
jgi:hypothetical protein